MDLCWRCNTFKINPGADKKKFYLALGSKFNGRDNDVPNSTFMATDNYFSGVFGDSRWYLKSIKCVPKRAERIS